MFEISDDRLSSSENIKILNRLRLIAIIGQLSVIVFSYFYLEINLPIKWLSLVLTIESCFAIYSHYKFEIKRQKLHETPLIELVLHLVIDSFILAALVYFSGGSNNPFIYLLLLPVALSAFMLTPGYLIAITLLQLLLYSLLYSYYRPLELSQSSILESFHLHMMGMWVNFIITAVLIAVFGLISRLTMLRQEKKIQALREKNLQDEQILGLGIMSANAAHELSTPLSTMAIIVEDIQHDKLTLALKEDMQLLDSQINKCKEIIAVLTDKSQLAQEQISLNEREQLRLQNNLFKKRLMTIIENWLVYRPQIIVEQSWQEGLSSIEQSISMSVEQAITNLLDNAADASVAEGNDHLTITVYKEKQSLIIDILDYGKGVSNEMKLSMGQQIQQTQKQDGLGWGLFLSNVSVERIGGKVQLVESNTKNTITRITLPLVGIK